MSEARPQEKVLSPTKSSASNDKDFVLETEVGATGSMKAPQSFTAPLVQPSSHGWRFWMIFVPLCIGNLLVALETTITALALPAIVSELHSADAYVWFMNGYLLTNTALLPLYGQLATVFGRRWPSIFAVAIFTLGSGICGGATSTAMLIAGRVVQGVGGGGISVMTQLVISDLVSVRERGKYMGIILAVFGLGTTLGPVLGGIIISHTTWRWAFWLNLPIGGLTLLLQFFFLQVQYTKRSSFAEKMKKIDWIGNFILIASVVSVLIALSWADTRYPWSSWKIIVPLVLGFLGAILFHTYEATSFCEQPTLPPRAFGNRTSAVALILTFTQAMLMYWRIYFLPIYFQAVLLYSPQSAGILLLPTVATGIPFAVIAGFILSKTGRYKPLHVAGFALVTLASGLYTSFGPSSSLGDIVGYQIVAGLGAGCVLTTLLPAIQASLPQKDVAVATSTWGFIRAYGSIWGIAIPATILNSAFAKSLSTVTDPAVRAIFSRGNAYSQISNMLIRSLPDETKTQIIDGYSSSLRELWRVALALSAASFLLVFVEKEIKLRTTVKSDYIIKQPVSRG